MDETRSVSRSITPGSSVSTLQRVIMSRIQDPSLLLLFPYLFICYDPLSQSPTSSTPSPIPTSIHQSLLKDNLVSGLTSLPLPVHRWTFFSTPLLLSVEPDGSTSFHVFTRYIKPGLQSTLEMRDLENQLPPGTILTLRGIRS